MKIRHMDRRPTHIMEINLYLSKAHNWKSPGNDQIQNYWLKACTRSSSTLEMDSWLQGIEVFPQRARNKQLQNF